MDKNSRHKALNNLIEVAEARGYLTFDVIMDCAEQNSLPLNDFDWLTKTIAQRNIIIYEKDPKQVSGVDSNREQINKTDSIEFDEYDDYSRLDYEEIYDKVIAMNHGLISFISKIRSITPPQRGEVIRLIYQAKEGNAHARTRMIEMYLRLAVRIALQRAQVYDLDIEDTIGDACIGLVNAIDKYDPEVNGAFASYASFQIFGTLQRRQSVSNSLIYYPMYMKEKFFSIYPFLKEKGCLECSKFLKCMNSIYYIDDEFFLHNYREIKELFIGSVPALALDSIIKIAYQYDDEECDFNDLEVRSFENELAHYVGNTEQEAIIRLDRDMFRKKLFEITKELGPRESEVLELRFGINDGYQRTLEEVGQHFGVTRERIRQIEAKALRKLRTYICEKRDFL